MRSLPEGYDTVIDEEAIIRYVNNRLLRMSGYTRTELYGNSIGVIFRMASLLIPQHRP